MNNPNMEMSVSNHVQILPLRRVLFGLMSETGDDLISEAEQILERVLDLPARRFRVGLQRALEAKEGLQVAEAIASLRQDVQNAPKDDFKSALLRLFLQPYRTSLKLTADSGRFMPEDFVDLFTDFAEAAGIDLQRLGAALTQGQDHSEYAVGIAARAIFESAGVYIEFPNACTISEVPRKLIILVGAALIGIATAKAAELDSRVAGAIGGVGGLILNVMAARYDKRTLDPKTDWLEEVVLRALEQYGIQSFEQLCAVTNIHPPLLKRVLTDLRWKGLVDQHLSWLDKTDLRYDLSGRH